MLEKIKSVLEGVRPGLQSHGGDLEFVSFDEETKVVGLRMQGACHGCPHAMETIKMYIEMTLRAEVDPEISVAQVADDPIPGPAEEQA